MLDAHLFDRGGWKRAMDDGDVDACFGEDGGWVGFGVVRDLEDGGDAEAAFGALP